MGGQVHPSKRRVRILRIVDGALGGLGEGEPVVRRGSGPVDVLLRGDAVRYLARRSAPPRGVRALFYVAEEAAARGLAPDRLAGEPIAQASVPRLLGCYEQVWHY
jgi:hypothetical protein